MADKATSFGKQTKQGKSASKSGTSPVNENEDRKRISEDDWLDTPEGSTCSTTQPDPIGRDPGEIEGIKEEIPEALAYFLEVYGRLGRG